MVQEHIACASLAKKAARALCCVKSLEGIFQAALRRSSPFNLVSASFHHSNFAQQFSGPAWLEGAHWEGGSLQGLLPVLDFSEEELPIPCISSEPSEKPFWLIPLGTSSSIAEIALEKAWYMSFILEPLSLLALTGFHSDIEQLSTLAFWLCFPFHGYIDHAHGKKTKQNKPKPTLRDGQLVGVL